MRDVKTGDISAGRDVVINDQSDQPKLLVQCTNEELLEEEQHRRSILRKEESRQRRPYRFYKLIFSGEDVRDGSL